MNKILVVNINWLGDAIFSTPVFAALKGAYPSAHVACLCVPRVAEVLAFCPDVDEIIIYDEKGRDRWPWNKLRLILQLRQKKFDAAFVLHRSMSRGLLVYLAGVPQRIGFGKAKVLLTHPIGSPSESIHRRDQYLKVIEKYGIAVPDRRCSLRLSEAPSKSADEKLMARGITAEDKFIVFNTGGNWDLKRWPVERWVGLTRYMHAHSKLKMVFSGAQTDHTTVKKIIEQANVPAVNLAGQTTLGESLRVFARAKVVVSADSGPLHLASSVGTKVVGIFGPTRPEITGPQGRGESDIVFKAVGCNKTPCYHLGCINNVCMKSIEVEDVGQVVQKFTG